MMRWFNKPVRFVPLLALLSFFSFFSIMRGDFLHDDREFIQANSDLSTVATIADCFTFQHQYTKPIANLFIAFGYWLDHGVFGQRLLSIILHALVVIFFCLNSLLLCSRLALDRTWVPWAALLFAISPIHSETIVIAQFRGEVIGTLFALVAFYFCQKIASASPRNDKEACARNDRVRISLNYIGLFVAWTFSALSKEIFVFIVPMGCFLFFFSGKKIPRFEKLRFSFFVVGFAVLGVTVLVIQAAKDGTSQYSYVHNVGLGVLSFDTHVRIAARALVEGVQKLLLGRGLTSLRLLEREGLGAGWGFLLSWTVLFSWILFCLALIRITGWWRVWGGLFFASVSFYLAVPNVNIGSEHYWYFAALPFYALLVQGALSLLKRCDSKAKHLSAHQKLFRQHIASVVGLCYVVFLSIGLQSRLVQLHSRLSLAFAELDAHPESAATWSEVAIGLLKESQPKLVPIALDYIVKAEKISPSHYSVAISDFIYAYTTGETERARTRLHQIERLKFPPRKMARFYRDFAILNLVKGDCDSAD
ncbi:MAG: hypothetical protein HY537_10080, partial [Deltaproteobacteria bacterium]|nr:hypothetical protein [Deltaproteobacteria bacterium]